MHFFEGFLFGCIDILHDFFEHLILVLVEALLDAVLEPFRLLNYSGEDAAMDCAGRALAVKSEPAHHLNVARGLLESDNSSADGDECRPTADEAAIQVGEEGLEWLSKIRDHADANKSLAERVRQL